MHGVCGCTGKAIITLVYRGREGSERGLILMKKEKIIKGKISLIKNYKN